MSEHFDLRVFYYDQFGAITTYKDYQNAGARVRGISGVLEITQYTGKATGVMAFTSEVFARGVWHRVEVRVVERG